MPPAAHASLPHPVPPPPSFLLPPPQGEWEAIPEIGDYTIKKKARGAGFTPAPDSLLARAAAADATGTTVVGGLETPMGGGTTTDLTAIGAGRSTVVQLKLDRISDSVSGQTVVDPKGYLTDLKSVTLKSGAQHSVAQHDTACRGTTQCDASCPAAHGLEQPARPHSPQQRIQPPCGAVPLHVHPTHAHRHLHVQMPRSATSRRRACC